VVEQALKNYLNTVVARTLDDSVYDKYVNGLSEVRDTRATGKRDENIVEVVNSRIA